MWIAEEWEWARSTDPMGVSMAIDPMHVKALYDIAIACGWRKILELGSFDGYSTSAFVQAKIDKAVRSLVCVDREIRPLLMQVLECARDGWCAAQWDTAEAVRETPAGDFVFVDSDHDLATTQREFRAIMDRGWTTIAAHDVGSKGGCDGPRWMLDELLQTPEWWVLVDEKPRDGMRTDRGLMVATRERRVFEAVSRVWTEWRVPEPCKS